MSTKRQERYLNVIHIIRYGINTLQTAERLYMLQDYCRAMHSIKIKCE